MTWKPYSASGFLVAATVHAALAASLSWFLDAGSLRLVAVITLTVVAIIEMVAAIVMGSASRRRAR